MPWNGAGNFSRTNGVNSGTEVWQDDRDTVGTILADRQDVHDQDIADGLNIALTKDGQSWPPTVDLNLGNFKFTSCDDAAQRNQFATYKQLQDNEIYMGDAGGTADAITLTPSPALPAYVTGQVYYFKATATNTDDVTVNISGLGAKSIKDVTGSEIFVGGIASGRIYQIIYDGTDFRINDLLQGPAYLLQDNVYGLGTRQSFGRYVEAIRSAGGTGSPQPTIDTIRRNITLSSGNLLGGFRYLGPDDALIPNEVTYGDIVGRCQSPAEGAISGEILIRTAIAGSTAKRLTAGKGVSIGNLDPLKDGDCNAVTFSRSNVQVSAYESAETAVALGDTLAFEHNLGGRAKLYQMYLVCKTAIGGYGVGDEICYGGNGTRQGGQGSDTSIFSIWTEDATHIRLQVPDKNWHLSAKNTGTYFETGVAEWNVLVRASGW